MSTYADYLELRKGPPSPSPSPYNDHVLIYVDDDGIIHTLQPDGSDWKAGTGLPGSSVHELVGPWQASNPTVVLTPDGVVFGPYADGAATGGSLRYLGLNGQPFSVVKTLAFSMRFISDDKNDAGSPYLRVWMDDVDGVNHDAIFTPGSQDYPGLGQGPLQEYVATAGTWRYDSDDGSNSEFGTGAPLAEVLAKYGDQVITKMAITLGWTAGDNLRGLLRWWQINNTRYTFIGQGAVVQAEAPATFAVAVTPPMKPE